MPQDSHIRCNTCCWWTDGDWEGEGMPLCHLNPQAIFKEAYDFCSLWRAPKEPVTDD